LAGDTVTFTIGDPARSFDIATIVTSSSSTGVRATVVTPDAVNDEVRSEKLEVTFTGLTPGKFVSMASDLDAANRNTTEDFTRVFFNNGDVPNATILVEFSDGRSLTMTVPDGSAPGDVYTFEQTSG
jgi:hypothetical protein